VLLTRRGTTYLVDIQAMYDYGAREQNALLEQGDIVNVSDRSYNKMFVLGEVAKPGSLVMNKKRSTLAEALSDCRLHQSDNTSDPRWVYVMRGNSDTPEFFHLECAACRTRCCSPIAFPLRPRDIIYVDTAADCSLAAGDCQHIADRNDAQSDQPDLLPALRCAAATVLTLTRAVSSLWRPRRAGAGLFPNMAACSPHPGAPTGPWGTQFRMTHGQ
jgi:hypothetical protein